MRYVTVITIMVVVAALTGCKQTTPPAPTGSTGVTSTATTGTRTPTPTGTTPASPASRLPGAGTMKKIPPGQKTTMGTCAQCGKQTQVYQEKAINGKTITVCSPLCLRRYNAANPPMFNKR